MKVWVATGDRLLAELLLGLLDGREGVEVRQAEAGTSPPRGHPGWVLARAAQDSGPGHAAPEVVFHASASPPRNLPAGAVPVPLPCSASQVLEALAAAAALAEAGAAMSRPAVASGRPAIVVAEDSPLQRSLVVANLKSEGFAVVEAGNGMEALAALEQAAAALLITDVEMPEMDGFELTRRVRAHPRLARLPVLMLTTLSGFEQVKQGFDSGATDYLVKPLKGERELFLDELIARVYHLLESGRPSAGRRALVVDDSAATRKLVAGYLEAAGFLVQTAEDGLLARECLDQAAPGERPDVVVTDLEMPRMDGLRLTHWVTTNPSTRDIPVILLSASTQRHHRMLGKGFGAEAFLSKPFSEEKLLVTVEQVLIRRRLELERRELSRILGRDVIRAIHKGGLAPRKRVLTILFSDIAGFSTLCASKEAPEVVELLNEYFDLMVDLVAREQGYVNKFIGDALMALFSVLPGLPGPEERAVRAAVSIQREMQRLNAGRPVPLVTRIGINTGEVVMGVIGAGERKDYTVIGDQVNRGQRFEGKAHPGGVLVSEGTYREAAAWLAGQGDLCVEKLDGLLLKGIPAPVSAWSITLKGQP